MGADKEDQERKKEKSRTDRFIDFIFSNDDRKWLLLIFVLGLTLRSLMANNISLLGDEAVHGPHIIGFLHAGLISTFAHSPLWFLLGDIFLKLLGATVFSLRFTSVLYGALSILIIYLISAHIFNKKTALLSSFLLSVSFFTIRFTLMEMDISCLFFLLLAVYSFILSTEKNKFPWLAAICIGLAALIKTLSLFFVPAFIIGFFLFIKKEENVNKKVYYKKIILNIILFGLIISAFFLPILMHNYFWCQDKGMMDVYFAKYFKGFKNTTGFPQCFNLEKAQQVYGMQQGYETTFEHNRFFQGVVSMSWRIFSLDPLLLILGLLGIFLTYSLKDKRKYWIFFILFNILGFVFLVLTDWLATHFVTMIPVLCIFGSFFMGKSSEDLSRSIGIDSKMLLGLMLLIVFIFQLIIPPIGETKLYSHLTSECAMSQMRDYAVHNMDKNSIVLVDSRIYTGRSVILFNDFHYLDASLFSSLMQMNENNSDQIPVKIYYLECASDDCGWGTIASNPALNKSMEEFTASFSQASIEKTILGGGGYDEQEGKPYFRIYSGVINLNPQLISLVDSTHDWWYYPVNYKPKNKIFDVYNVNGGINQILYQLMWLILWISVILAITLSFAPIYYLIKNKN